MTLENNPNLQKVEGYVSKITKDGNKVTDDSLSSGGVRHQNGTLEELIKEPRLVENPSKLNSFATSVIGDVTNQLTQKVANHLVNEVIPRSINNWKERRAEKKTHRSYTHSYIVSTKVEARTTATDRTQRARPPRHD